MVLFDLLRNELNTTPFDKQSMTEEVLAEAYPIACRHDIVNLIGHAVVKNGLLPQENELYAAYQKKYLAAVYRVVNFEYYTEQLITLFCREGIPFILLKGSVLRNMYPESWMRTSCDIDILVHSEDLERSVTAVVEQLGFQSTRKRSHDVLLTKNNVHIELHFDLIEEGRANLSHQVLSEIWNYATPVGDTCQYALSDDMFYYYHMAHMVKHFENTGCGIRLFLDIWVLNHRTTFDKDKRYALLQRGGLEKFAVLSEKLADAWISGTPMDDMLRTYESFIIRSAVYGSLKDGVTLTRTKTKNKSGYLLKRLFPSGKRLAKAFPILNKHPWLFPFVWVVRLFHLFMRRSREIAKNQIHLNLSMSKEEIDKLQKLLDALSLTDSGLDAK